MKTERTEFHAINKEKLKLYCKASGKTMSQVLNGAIDALPDNPTEKLPYDTTGFALLDIGKGRAKLARAIEKKGRFKVMLEANIIDQHGRDDGVSIEFELDITKFNIERR